MKLNILEQELYDALRDTMQFIIAWEFEYSKPEYRGEEHSKQRRILTRHKAKVFNALQAAKKKLEAEQ